ncbi:MAG: Eco29kI family restriction endonuclease [Actinomyces graevenitzii]|uniref:Eco29kI family restriction endonuclease n=1 Tax=Actinomyces graevenitzii TaxID=55565 RepID=A0A9E7AK06_9ACTO|nr:MAG: Eco29kI family restriction endonuclease [Actinomyces graevenitzii]
MWNAVLDGFGNHDPGSGRSNSVRSKYCRESWS